MGPDGVGRNGESPPPPNGPAGAEQSSITWQFEQELNSEPQIILKN